MKKQSLIIWCFSIVSICWSQSIFDDFDNYNAGEYLGIESNGLWTTWNNSPGGAEDAIISNEHSYSSNNSIKLQSGSPTDVILPLGNKTSGNWVLSYMMRIEPGYGAYFNLLHEFDSEASNWAVQVYFSQTGHGYLTVGSGFQNSIFTHPVGSWFEVKVDVDIDNNLAYIVLNDAFILSWIWSKGSMNEQASSSTKLAALNLFPAASGDDDALYYVDNVSFSEYEIGLSESESQTSIYPNPATNYFSLRNAKSTDVQVFNLLGAEIFTLYSADYEQVIDCSSWKSGVYFVQTTKKDGSIQRSKLIVK